MADRERVVYAEGEEALRLYRQDATRPRSRWTNARHDPVTRETGAEQRGRARLALLVAAGIIARTERAPTFALRGYNGGHICNYTPDDLVWLKDGTIVAVEWKGRRSRDFALRAALWCDDYVWPGPFPGAGHYRRLDIVPVLSFQEQRDAGIGAYDLIDAYDPTSWPDQERASAARMRAGERQRALHTRRTNQVQRAHGGA